MENKANTFVLENMLVPPKFLPDFTIWKGNFIQENLADFSF